MGAVFNDHKIVAKNLADAVRAAEAYQQARQYEQGHGPYTGHLGTSGVGVQYSTRRYETYEEACKEIQEMHDKWSRPILARINDGTWILAGWCSS